MIGVHEASTMLGHRRRSVESCVWRDQTQSCVWAFVNGGGLEDVDKANVGLDYKS